MNKLARHLFDHLVIDFEGALSVEQARELLQSDNSRESRMLISKLVSDGSTNEMILTIAEVLKDYLRTGISEDTVRDQLKMYSDS